MLLSFVALSSPVVSIGLALVKRIIETYDGTIWVESEFGQGSTFFFTVPKHNSRIRHAETQYNTVS